MMDKEQIEKELQYTRKLYSCVNSIPQKELARFTPFTQAIHKQTLKRLHQKGLELNQQLEEESKNV